MSLARLLGLGRGDRDAGATAETATVRRIVEALERLEPETARRLARFAYILGRVSHADLEVSPEETRAMERLVSERGRLPAAQAVLIVQIAKSQAVLFGGTEDYLVTREFAASASREEKTALLECCFAVSAADRDVSSAEEAVIRQIASELGLEHADFIRARSAYREYLAVLRKPAGG
jgi:uncharacterized tellurite resistance protein B-like protein